MSFFKTQVVDSINVLEDNTIQIRTKTVILEDGIPISSQFHRHAVTPNSDYSNEDAKVKAIASAIYTPEVIAAYVASLEARQA